MFRYVTVDMVWKKLDEGAGVKGTGPSSRSGHAMTGVGKDIYVFGGTTQDQGESWDTQERVCTFKGGTLLAPVLYIAWPEINDVVNYASSV